MYKLSVNYTKKYFRVSKTNSNSISTKFFEILISSEISSLSLIRAKSFRIRPEQVREQLVSNWFRVVYLTIPNF